MEFLQRNARAIVVALLAVGVVAAISVASNNNGDDTAQEPTTSETTTSPEESAETATTADEAEPETSEDSASEGESSVTADDETYTISAAAGDSQTAMVRAILDEHLQGADKELSPEQQLYVVTNLVNNLPSDDLIYVGDSIRLTKADVASTVDAAENLSETRLAAWSAYL